MSAWFSSIASSFGFGGTSNVENIATNTIRGKSLEPVSYINDLPNELLLEIFNYLSERDLANCQLVCRLWRVISADKTLWNRIFDRRKLPLPKQKVPNSYFYMYESFYRNAANLKQHMKIQRPTKRRRTDDTLQLTTFLQTYDKWLPYLHRNQPLRN